MFASPENDAELFSDPRRQQQRHVRTGHRKGDGHLQEHSEEVSGGRRHLSRGTVARP